MSAQFSLDSGHKIGADSPTFIIAEIGQNHQGDINLARKLIQVAKDCGVDCAKFQKTCLPEKFNKLALDRPYNSPNSWGPTYGEHKEFLEFSQEEFKELQNFAGDLGILFSASAMDLESLNFLASIRVPFIKIGSGDSNNLDLIEKAAATGIPLIISTGMLEDFQSVHKIYKTVSAFHKKFALLHCISSYPTPVGDVNLNIIPFYKQNFQDIPVGYSGHELGINISQCAVSLGAKIIERHLTLDKNFKGSDHKSSLDPLEFKNLISNIREIERALGQPVKQFQKSEQECYVKLGKSIVASKLIKSGSKIVSSDLKIKVAEPKGIDGRFLEDLVGKIAVRDINLDESVTDKCIE